MKSLRAWIIVRQEGTTANGLSDLWYSLKWDVFDTNSKLILADGIELLIDKEQGNPKLYWD